MTTATGSVLRHREFRLLWLAQVVSSFGDSLTGLTLLILVNHLTGSTTAIATLTILLAVPTLAFGLIAGVYVDRFDRKRIMLISDAVRALIVVGLIFADSKEHLWVLFVLSFLQAAVGTFFNPARGALVQQLVPKEQLLEAGSLSQTSIVLANLAGAACAGVLYGLTQSFWLAFVIDAATFLVSFGLVLAVRAPKLEPKPQTAASGGVLRELLEGMQVVRQNRILVAIMVGGGVCMLGLGAVNVLFVPFVINILKVPPTWLGAVEGAQTVGMVLSGALMTGFASKLNPRWLIVICLAVVAVLTSAIGLIPNVIAFAIMLFGIGLVVVPLNASAGALMQQHVSNEVMGRVGSSFNTVMTSANLISMAVAGVLGAQIGIPSVFVIAGGIVGVSAIVCGILMRGDATVPSGAVNPVDSLHDPGTLGAHDQAAAG